MQMEFREKEIVCEIVDLRDYLLQPCIGCGKCFESKRCCNDINAQSEAPPCEIIPTGTPYTSDLYSLSFHQCKKVISSIFSSIILNFAGIGATKGIGERWDFSNIRI